MHMRIYSLLYTRKFIVHLLARAGQSGNDCSDLVSNNRVHASGYANAVYICACLFFRLLARGERKLLLEQGSEPIPPVATMGHA